MTDKPYQWQGGHRPLFTEEDIEKLLGKVILIGITKLDADDRLIEQIQMYGVVESASQNGVIIALQGKRIGEKWTMPPDMRAIKPAPRGEYRLKSTGEIVIDPDFTATWTETGGRRH